MRNPILKRILAMLPSLVLLTAASPALAASDYCVFSWAKFWTTSCETSVGVPANRSGHFVYFEVSPFVNYRYLDRQSGVTLRRGTAGALGHHTTIFGLYGSWYTAIVSGPPAGWARINNT